MYEHIAEIFVECDVSNQIGLVVGGNCIDELQTIHRRFPSTPLLLPGIGSQGGKIEEVTSIIDDFDKSSEVKNSIEKQLIYEKIKESLTQPIYNIAVLGHANLSNLEKALSEKLKSYLPERRFSFYSIPYGQFAREIMESSSGLRSFKPYIKIFTSNINDLSPMMEKDDF